MVDSLVGGSDKKGWNTSAVKSETFGAGASNFTNLCRQIRVGTAAGNVEVIYEDGTSDTIPNVQVGERLDVFARGLGAGTTADGITAFY